MNTTKKTITYFTPTYVVGVFEGMTEPEKIVRKDKEDLKAVVTIVTEDGQKGFFEVRKRMIRDIQMLGIQPGQKVKIGFVFAGSQKDDRRYNNLFINEIEI